MMDILFYLILGLAAGALSGVLGIGGGIIVVPALALLLGMSQHAAQGTTLAMMVPPIGLLAAWTYYKHGFVDLKIATLLCLGFFIGGLLGAQLGTAIPSTVLKRIFGVVLFIVSVKIILEK
jgi:uncharacterized protein